MRVIYTGDPAELERGEGLSRLSTTIYGVTFPMSAEVDVSHLNPVLQQKLMRNAHFRLADAPAAPVAFVIPAMPQASVADGGAKPPKVKRNLAGVE